MFSNKNVDYSLIELTKYLYHISHIIKDFYYFPYREKTSKLISVI